MSIIIETEQDMVELEENIIYGLIEPQEIITKIQLSEELISTALEMGFTLTDGESSSNDDLEEDSITKEVRESTVETQEVKSILTKSGDDLKNNEVDDKEAIYKRQEVEEKSPDAINIGKIGRISETTEIKNNEFEREENLDEIIDEEDVVEDTNGVTNLFEMQEDKKEKKSKHMKEKKSSSGFLSKIFKKKKFEPEEIKLRVDYVDVENTREVSAVASIKKYIIANHLMSKRDIETVDRYIEQNSAYSKKLFFLDTACALNLLDEETCTKILSINKSMDVISTKTVMQNWERILRINSKIFQNKSVQDYFVLDVIDNEVVVVTDPEYSKSNTSFYDIEIEYTGFNLTRCNMLDSSFAQIVSKLNKDIVTAKIS